MGTEPGAEPALLDAVLRPSFSAVHRDAAVANECGVPVGAVFSPCAVPFGAVPRADGPPPRCGGCGGALGCHCSADASRGQWRCGMCGRWNAGAAEPPASPVVDFLEPPGAEAQARGDARTVVFLLDGTLDTIDVEGMRECVRRAAGSLQPSWRVALVTFGGALCLHELAGGALAAGDVLPYEAPAEAWRARLAARLSAFVAPVDAARGHLLDQVAALRGSDARGPVASRARCLGAALHLGLEVAAQGKAAWGGSGHVLCILGGPGTLGQGQAPAAGADEDYGGLLLGDAPAGYLFGEARGFYRGVVRRAQADGVAVDILGGGSRAINVPLLAPVAQLTGGGLALHEDLGGLLADNAARAVARQTGVAGWVDLACSAGLAVTRIVGPSLPLPEAERRRRGLSRSATAMASAEPGHGWGVYLEPARASLAGHGALWLQATASWVLPGGWRVHRVATRRLGVAGSAAEMLDGVGHAAAAVLLGKAAAAAAIRAGWPHEDGLRAGARVVEGAVAGSLRRFGRGRAARPASWGEWVTGRGSAREEAWEVPRALEPFLLAAYHLARGPLLGGVAGHADEHSQLHSAMVQAGGATGAAMVAPQLWRMLPDGTWHLSPCVDLALLPTSVLVLDHGTHIYVWLGSSAEAAPHAPLLREAGMRLVEVLRRDRYPLPEVRVTHQGHGDSRYVLSRLSPAHRDPEHTHPAQWPPLGDAATEARRALVRQIPPSDLPSFAEWCARQGAAFPAGTESEPETVAEWLRGP